MSPRPSPNLSQESATLVELLRHRAREHGERPGFAFWADGEREEATLTFGELDGRARAIGARVQAAAASGQRVLLLYPPGLEFVAAFYGCLYGGGVAVPAPAADAAQLRRTLPRLRSIAQDCEPALVLTCEATRAEIEALLPELLGPGSESIEVVATDTLAAELADAWTPFEPTPARLAFLQYTSGSTSEPKGVAIAHGNLHYTCRDIDASWHYDAESVSVSWCPIFHDMGLVVGVALPVYAGFRSVLMSPLAFIQRPVRWLAAISRERATHSCAPNFAYDLAVRKISADERATLDLSCWKVSLNSAEPVRWDTIQAFSETFAPCGFQPEVFCPGFGLAESTVKVTASERGAPVRVMAVDAAELEQHRVVPVDDAEAAAQVPGGRRAIQWIVGNGAAILDSVVRAVDPETRVPVAPGQIGEIWVKSPSVASSYWNRPELSAETFGAQLVEPDGGEGDGPFLRTGDLGFLGEDGELYITGRAKDLIVVRGRNVYPQDIERAAETCHSAVRAGCSAAFGVERDGEERLALVAEIDPRRGAQPGEVLEAIRRQLLEEFDLVPAALALLAPRHVPKTSSGKVQRKHSRTQLESLAFEPLGFYGARLESGGAAVGARMPGGGAGTGSVEQRAERLRWHLVAHFAPELPGLSLGAPETEAALREQGLDLATAQRWAARFEDELGLRFDPLGFFEPGLSIAGLAQTLARLEARDVDEHSDVGRGPSAPDVSSAPVGAGAAGAAGPRDTAAIERWLRTELAARTGIAPAQIDPGQDFAHYGLDSLQAVDLAAALETWLGRSLPATLVWDHPTLRAAAQHLADEPQAEQQAEPQAELRAVTSAVRSVGTGEPIAIVGMGCRFPGADGIEAFWDLLREGRDGIREVPAERWDVDATYHPSSGVPGKSTTRWGGFLADVERFDAGFFGISGREAARMDPQQRLLLEVAWEALESGGLSADTLRGSRTGVFVGLGSGDYARIQLGRIDAVDAYAATGNAFSVAAGRLSYVFDLRGPSLAIDTACSSSLVAIHQARRSLLAGECDAALAGGVNLILSPEWNVAFSHAQMMAADGHCKTFDARADGYVRGEGCGIVVLKRLADAERDGDTVLALVRGSAVNQDGHSNGITAPNGPSQRDVIRAALADAQLTPTAIDYIEAHGTGTPLGDPIEVQALAEVFGEDRPADRPCVLGSVKTNVGHLEAAAGVCGVIKTVLALQHGEVPAHLHLEKVNPRIELGSLFVIPRERRPWPSAGSDSETRGAVSSEVGPRRAGVSSFGFGGTNAHVVLEEAPGRRLAGRAAAERSVHPILLSARSEAELAQVAGRLRAHLEDGRLLESGAVTLGDVAHTLATGRAHLAERAGFLARTPGELLDGLRALERGGDDGSARRGSVRPGAERRVAFLFTGQGAQYAGMGSELYRTSPTFRRSLEEVCAHLDAALTGANPEARSGALLDGILGRGNNAPDLSRTAWTQPALFALEWALFETWSAFGIVPSALIGHSVGEIAAACAAGVLSVADGARLVVTRARLMGALPEDGAMASIQDDPARVEAIADRFAGRLSVAARNGPRSTVLSGERGALAEACDELRAQGARCTTLEVSHAFHSPLVEPMLSDLEWFARTLPAAAPRVPFVSNVSGAFHDGAPDAAYWREHVRRPVDFRRGTATVLEAGCDTLIELGPHPVLLALARSEAQSRAAQSRAARPGEGASLAYLPSLRRGAADQDVLAGTLLELFCRGLQVDWEAVDRDHGYARVALPTYPFARQPHWIQLPGEGPARTTEVPRRAPLTMNDPGALDPSSGDAASQRPAGEQALAQVVALFREQTATLLSLSRALAGDGTGALQDAIVEATRGFAVAAPTVGALAPSDSGAEPHAPAASADGAPAEITPESVAGCIHRWIARISGTSEVQLRPHSHLHRDLGFDSLMIVELDRRIRGTFPGVGDAEEMFTEDTTVQGLVELVVDRLREHGSMDLMTEFQRSARDYATYSELIAKDPSETYVGGAFKTETHTLHTLRAEGRRMAGLMDVVNKYSGGAGFHLTQMGAYSFLVQLMHGYLCYKHGVTKEGLGMPKLNRIHMVWGGLVRTSTDIPGEIEERECRVEDGVYTIECAFELAGGAVKGVIEGFIPIATEPRPEAERVAASWPTFAELIGKDPRETYTGGTFKDEVQVIHDLHAEGRKLTSKLDVENQFSGTPHFHLTQMGTYSYLVQLMLGYFCYKHGVVKDDLGMPTLEEFFIDWREMVPDSKDIYAEIEERSCTLESGRYRVEFSFVVGDDNGRGRLVGRIPVPTRPASS